MPYIAQRRFKMFGQEFAPPGNVCDLPHIIPSDLVERMPHRSLSNMLTRGMIRQVEATAVVVSDAIARPSAAFVGEDPRVVNEGTGWWLVDGKRVHGRKGVEKALAELGG